MLVIEIIKLAHELRYPTEEVDLVLVAHYMLLSGVNFVDAYYVTVLDKEGINVYDGKTTKIIIAEKAVLSWYLREYGLWHIPLKKYIQNFNTDTLLIQRPSPNKAISHVFELPSTEEKIAYYHAAVVFPIKKI